MKRFNKKKKLYTILFILVMCIGIGYAYLNANLNINGTAKIKNNTWDIHFINLQVNSNSVDLSAECLPAAINPNDNTEVTYAIFLQKPGDFYEFTVDAKNFGTIDGMIETVISKLNGVEISSTNPLPNYLDYSVTYSDDIPIDSNHLLSAGSKVTYKVRLEYKRDIEISDLPSSVEDLTFSFGITSIQADETSVVKPEWPVIGNYNIISRTYKNSTYKEMIKIINLDDEINPPANPIVSWDIGEAQNGNVMAYITTNADNNNMYDLTIQGDGALYANPNSSGLFSDLTSVDSINNIDVLDTSKVTNMSRMFSSTGNDSTVFTLDLGSNFDTSNVTNMESMFDGTGYSSTEFTLNLGSKFDTSKVTNMIKMFYSTGNDSTVFTLDLGSKFDTSKVTDMNSMFCNTGYMSPVFTLNLGSKFDTSKVTDMHWMFWSTGFNSMYFTLDLGDKFNTSNVTTMASMFYCTGFYSPGFTLDLGDKFNTSKVTDMLGMFIYIGHENNNFELDLSTFDFSRVNSYDGMFNEFKSTQKIYVKDAAAQSWIINNAGNSNLTTANVLIKS